MHALCTPTTRWLNLFVASDDVEMEDLNYYYANYSRYVSMISLFDGN